MRSTLAAMLISLAFAAGCGVGYRGTVTVSATAPDLAYVAPGVAVIADYDEPIFYADGFYWWNYGGLWYRSSSYTDGWVYVSAPPVVITGIREPHRYTHYRPRDYVVHRRPVPAHQVRRPEVRDHRSERTEIRDHR